MLVVFDEAKESVRDLTNARGIERDCSEKVETLLRQGRKYVWVKLEMNPMPN
jgi:hypothetical protein